MSRTNNPNINKYLNSKGKWRIDLSDKVREMRKLAKPIIQPDNRTELQKIFAKN